MVQMQQIYVQLLEEGSAAARPTMAENLGNGTYKILPTENYGSVDEVWEFIPGTVVKCVAKEWNGKEYLLAAQEVKADQ